MKHESVDREVAEALECLHQVPPPDRERQAGQRLAFMGQARQARLLLSPRNQAGRAKPRGFISLGFLGSRRIAITGAVVALVLVMIAGTGGVIYAANGSVPGDPLYGIDRTVESVQLHLTRRPEATTRLLLSLAEERLREAQQLSDRGDSQNLDAALNGLSTVVSSLAQAVGADDEDDQAAVAALLDGSFPSQGVQPAGASQDVGTVSDGDDQNEPEADEVDACTQADPHPAAQRLAESYGVPYEDVIGWFCEGHYGLGEIMLALKTSQKTGRPAGDLLASKTKLGGWGKVWQDLGLIGKPAHSPGGPKDKSVAPAEEKPNGTPKDKSGGPPETKPPKVPKDKPAKPAKPDKPDKGKSKGGS
jgi:hypothetical protein